ncbi:MAG: hypothetical protein ABI311_07850 [Gemmatimonadaceae bacterium]
MAQTDRTLQETTTSLSPEDVLVAAKQFFAQRNSIYTAFPDKEGPTFVSLRGMGGEEVVVGVLVRDGVTVVSGSTYMFDQQVARFLTMLPPASVAAIGTPPAQLPEATEVPA